MLQIFKSFDAVRMQLDELVSLEAFGHDLREAYERLQIEEPAFLDVQLKTLRREIRTRNADRLEAKLRAYKQQLEATLTPGEKRKKLEAEIATLEKQVKGA